MPNFAPIRRALLSVADKAGLTEFAAGLSAAGVALVSTGGTKRVLAAAGVSAADVADITGFPEMMDGRVKTLHPAVHGGLLAIRDDAAHQAAMAAHGIEPIDLLVVSLYPFEAAVTAGANEAEAIEQIDIGGVALIRAAAKNNAYVTVVVDPADYAPVLAAIRADGGVPTVLRRALAAKAFARTAAYDAAIAAWFARASTDMPPWAAFGGTLVGALRYGENPHQAAAFYRNGDPRPGVGNARIVQGKALSYNNIADADAAYELVAEFDPARTAAAAVIKHANPCGVAEAPGLAAAYARARDTDPLSAFGGVVAVNRPLDAATAEAIAAIFTEVVIAPDASVEALAILAAKPNVRVLLAGALPDPSGPGSLVRSVTGGLLVQQRDSAVADDASLRVVTQRAPNEAQMRDLRFAMRVAKHVKSNAIVYVKDSATVGIGAGQMSRLDSTRMGAMKADYTARAAGRPTPATAGTVVASEAFFPFADGIEAVAAAGAVAIIQPGGSLRDADVIAAADSLGLAMVFSGVRHFRH